MYLSLIIIRLKQIYRAASEMGLFRVLFVVVLLSFALMALFTLYKEPEYRAWLTAGYFIGLLSIHLNRPDKQFIFINSRSHKVIFLLDYFLLYIPLFICQLYYLQFTLAFISLIAIGLLPFLNTSFQKRSLNNLILQAIPHHAFEWKAGVRRLFFFLTIIWLLAVAFSWFVGSVPILIFVLGVSIFSFYDKGESLPILMHSELNPRQFLVRKISVALALLSALLLPLFLAFIIFHPELWFIPFIELILFSSILTYTILLKYSFYRPNEKLVAGQIFSAIGALSIILPFFIPLIWVLTIRFYFKSVSNLKIYMDDFN